MSSTYRCVVRVPGMTTNGVLLSNEMAPQTITPCCGPVWCSTVRPRSTRCPGRLQTRLQRSSGHNKKRDSSLKTIRPQSAQFQVDRSRHHCSRTCRCTGVRECYKYEPSPYIDEGQSPGIVIYRIALDSIFQNRLNVRGYCIQVICILLLISGIEPNPGPKKQTTLFTEPTPTVKESPDTELKTMIVQMSSEIRNLDLTSVYLPEFGDVHLLMYADDIAIIGESRVNLQKKINLLKKYLGVNEMTLNESKSKVMVFRNGGKPSREDRWYWNDKPLMPAWRSGILREDNKVKEISSSNTGKAQGTMTSQRYVDDVLRPVTLPYLQGVPNALYQQDNARPHTARISQQALQDVQMLPWSPYFPDLTNRARLGHHWTPFACLATAAFRRRTVANG
ncbi:hypothetical protein LAZ67_X003784 [Cordylochernes scorpioides]|uniref:Reverse transcriptase domain-containing protein n=1 Tax=Cordylochernes scorpioides TaxID=51811 RepID=A0ABY6LYJ1_9ARAC|nr:hypothetical protein LAZ67_X003784 [Cordylochernes scorpioides]